MIPEAHINTNSPHSRWWLGLLVQLLGHVVLALIILVVNILADGEEVAPAVVAPVLTSAVFGYLAGRYYSTKRHCHLTGVVSGLPMFAAGIGVTIWGREDPFMIIALFTSVLYAVVMYGIAYGLARESMWRRSNIP